MSHDLTPQQDPLSPYPVAQAVSLPGAGTVDLVDIVRRNFWLILGYTILCVSAAVAHVVLARPSYRAEAAIRIEDRRQPIPAFAASSTSITGAESEYTRWPNGPISDWMRSQSFCSRLRSTLW